jgi:hypothetical protein
MISRRVLSSCSALGRLVRWSNLRPLLSLVTVLVLSSSLLSAHASEPLESTILIGTSRTIRAPGRDLSLGFFTGSVEYRVAFPYPRLSALACFEWRGSDRYFTAGLFFRILETDRFVFGVGSGPGFFDNGRFTLGSKLEFRSVAEVQIKLGRHYRLGLDYCHYSNGGTGSINPGAESIRVFLAIRT